MAATTGAAPLPTEATTFTERSRSAGLGRRKMKNALLWGSCTIALALVVSPLLWIVIGVIAKGVSHWQWSALTHDHASASSPGLLNAVIGTFTLMAGIVVIGGVIGIAGGIYLAEYCPEGKGKLLRGASEVLSGVPSIVLGYVGFIALVVGFKGTGIHWSFGLLPAWIVVAVLVVPYITKSTEVAIRNVPTAYREGAESLGLSSGFTLRKLILRPALPGIVTGLIFAAAISVGETAPLIYTAHWSDHTNFSLIHSAFGGVGYLTYGVFEFLNEPSAHDHVLANDAAMMLVVIVLLLIVVSRVLVSLTQRYSPDRPQRLGRSGK
jgi:phosphate transport system permease protein